MQIKKEWKSEKHNFPNFVLVSIRPFHKYDFGTIPSLRFRFNALVSTLKLHPFIFYLIIKKNRSTGGFPSGKRQTDRISSGNFFILTFFFVCINCRYFYFRYYNCSTNTPQPILSNRINLFERYFPGTKIINRGFSPRMRGRLVTLVFALSCLQK